MVESFGAAVAAFTTRPVVMVAAAADPAKIFQNQPLTTSIETPATKKLPATPCTNRSFMLWSGLMSAEPRSDHRVDQGGENEKGNTHKGSRSTSISSMRDGRDIAVGSFLSCAVDVDGGGQPRRTLMSVDARRARPARPWSVGARSQHGGGLIATDRRSPRRVPLFLLPVSGRAGARASTAHVALTRVRRRRIASSGRPGESC